MDKAERLLLKVWSEVATPQRDEKHENRRSHD